MYRRKCLTARRCPLASERRLRVLMDHSITTVDCPDCAHPIPLEDFVNWGTQTMFKSTRCTECKSTVTYPDSPDGSLDITHSPIGRGVHGSTRAARETEVLASRPAVGQHE